MLGFEIREVLDVGFVLVRLFIPGKFCNVCLFSSIGLSLKRFLLSWR